MENKINPEIEKKFKIDPNNFTETPNKKKIEGGYGKVYFLTEKSTKRRCVHKLTKSSLSSQEITFNREVEILASCNHPAIVKFIGYDIVKKKGGIYLEEAEKGSLNDFILECKKNKTPITDTEKLIIAYGIARAMEYLHNKNIVHRDLKAKNVLLDSNLYPLVCDFGTSNIINTDISISNTVRETTYTIMAPEFIIDYANNNRKKPIDVFSYAMVLYFLIAQKHPFQNEPENSFCGKIVSGIRPSLDEIDSHEEWKELIKTCWDGDPTKRPTFLKICKELESSKFVTTDIDIELFNKYKEFINKQSTMGDEPEPEPEKSLIEKLKEDADNNYSDAQNSYALHLYNGLEIEANRQLARQYFERSASNGNYEAMLWYSLILQREGQNPKLAEEYFSKSIEEVSEAQSIQGQKLIEKGQIEDGSKMLLNAIKYGSISAMVSYGNLCEEEEEYGNPEVFYKMASNCCHCLDEIGFYFPVDRKVYYCETHDMKICEACAKSCHQDCDCTEEEINHSFVCECATKYFPENDGNKKCNFEFVGEMKSESIPVLYQHLYQCKDCNNKSAGKYICQQCIKNCHKGHNVVDCGIQRGYCSCGAKQLDKGKCKICTYSNTPDDNCSQSVIKQRFFQCHTCGLCKSNDEGICIGCAHSCHEDHVVFDRGVSKMKCTCNICKEKK